MSDERPGTADGHELALKVPGEDSATTRDLVPPWRQPRFVAGFILRLAPLAGGVVSLVLLGENFLPLAGGIAAAGFAWLASWRTDYRNHEELRALEARHQDEMCIQRLQLQQQAEAGREERIVARFSMAAKLLDDESETTRIAALYIIERVLHDSERDRPAVTDLLISFIRLRVGLSASDLPKVITGKTTDLPPPASRHDVDVALRILGRRPKDEHTTPLSLNGLNLRSTSMNGGNFDGADFSMSLLVGAQFQESSLRGARFSFSRMEACFLTKADVTDSDFQRAPLDLAMMSGVIGMDTAKNLPVDWMDAVALRPDGTAPPKYRP